MSDLYALLSSAVASSSALRMVVSLMPANADGLIYPPTYDNGQHIFRPAWINGEKHKAVLVDSVQSQANRIEMAVLDAHRRGVLKYPDIELRVKAETGTEQYSVLELSHRIYDAALRMSNIDGVLFAKSEIGKKLFAARVEKAAALYTHAPITIALGGWDSHGGGGPLTAKIPRLITSEIVGLDADPVDKGAVKFDPMDIRKDAGPVYLSKDPIRRFEIDKTDALEKKDYKPSEMGLGNVPNYSRENGAVITKALQTSVLSCAAARRIRFENEHNEYDDSRDLAGQTAILALGLFGLIRQMDAGYHLRSGCELFPAHEPRLEVIGRTLEEIEAHSIDSAGVLKALKQAIGEAEKHGLQWRKEPLLAEADERLITLVERSRKARKMEE